jgi:hypothetical protein
MFWFDVFLLGAICGGIAIVALCVWLMTGAIIGLLDAVEKSLVSLGGGRMIVGALYLIPAWLFVCALVQFISLAFSFVTTVVLR